jgi:hypothetical protein
MSNEAQRVFRVSVAEALSLSEDHVAIASVTALAAVGVHLTYYIEFDSAGAVPSIEAIASALDPGTLSASLLQTASQSTTDVHFAYSYISLSVPTITQMVGAATKMPSSSAVVNSIATSGGSQSSEVIITAVVVVVGCLFCVGMAVAVYMLRSESKRPPFAWPDISGRSNLFGRASAVNGAKLSAAQGLQNSDLVEWPTDLFADNVPPVKITKYEDVPKAREAQVKPRIVRRFDDPELADWPDDLFH